MTVNFDDVCFAIRSYKRAGRVATLKVTPWAKIFVPEAQADNYREYYGESVVVVPDEKDGNIAFKSNYILDTLCQEWEYIVLLDDDITQIGYWSEGHRHTASPDHLKWFFPHFFHVAESLGVRLWGINQAQDPMFCQAYKPFSLLSGVLGPLTCHIDPVLRFDPNMMFKEDYDFWFQNILRYRHTLRVNRYHYLLNHATKTGGAVSMRTHEREREAAKRMMDKWGSSYQGTGGTKGGKSASGKNILNSRISISIPGV